MNTTVMTIRKTGPSDARKADFEIFRGPVPTGLSWVEFPGEGRTGAAPRRAGASVGPRAASGNGSSGPGEWDPGARPEAPSLNRPAP